MRFEVHHYFHVDPGVNTKLDAILSAIEGLPNHSPALQRIETAMTKFTDEIADLNTELAGLTDAVVANGALIDSILDSVDENAADETALRQLVIDYRAQKDALVANTLKGTPAEPAPGPDTTGDVA